MSAQDLYTLVFLTWLLAAAAFVIGLHQMNSPATARRGNQLSAAGMTLAVVVTFLWLMTPGGRSVVVGHPVDSGMDLTAIGIIVVGFVVGGGAGLVMARRVAMTAMPQLVSLFNAVGGGAAALVAIDDCIRIVGTPELTVPTAIFVVLGVVIGSVTYMGSLIASGKLQGLVPGRPIIFPGARLITAGSALIMLAGLVVLVAAAAGAFNIDAGTQLAVLGLIIAAAIVFGLAMVLPIGGADMPVVISLLNSFTGTAAAMAGFVINSPVLIIAGALVGAAGGILTKLMADAMNRSLANIMIGGFGVGEAAAGASLGGDGGNVREIGIDDVAIQLAYAQKVIIVPGYGLAVAQAQHAARELADLLEARGVDVSYAIHPVAGRMPGHMNVLLAEANVPYPQLKEMDEINPEFPRTDVALVVGANDVTNPAARSNPASPIYGMPILDVDQAKSVVVIKRSMRPGYAGIDNELYLDPKTGMLFADAREGLTALIAAVKQL
jgi:NAD(P) transhydrogenase subunit beta